MIELPNDILYLIFQFLPFNDYKIINKTCNREITCIQKDSVDKISNWYYDRLLKDGYRGNFKKCIRYMILHLNKARFIRFPEKIVYKLYLNHNILNLIPKLKERKRSDVKKWLERLPLTAEDYMYTL